MKTGLRKLSYQVLGAARKLGDGFFRVEDTVVGEVVLETAENGFRVVKVLDDFWYV